MHHNRRMIKVRGVAGVVGVLMYIVLAISDPYIGPETKTTQEFLAAWGSPKYVAVNMALHFMFAVLAVYIQTLRSAKSFPDFQAEPTVA